MYIKHIFLGRVTEKMNMLVTNVEKFKIQGQAIPNEASVALSSKQYRIYANALKNSSLANDTQAGY